MKSNSASSALIEEVVRNLFFLLPDATSSPVRPVHLLVALSGGVDSVVLLHVMHGLQQRYPFKLSAMHVHHGLNPAADQWLQFCLALCQRLDIACDSHHLQLPARPANGIEAAARDGRYQALTACMQATSASAMLTAHHQQDQAETLLLQLARGAGVKGLSAMPVWDAARQLLRPMLGVTQSAIYGYARQHALEWVSDDSNDNQRFERNFMRHTVIPVMQQRYPQLTQNLARTSQHLAEAQYLLQALADIDLQACQPTQAYAGQSLSLPALLSLGEARAKNVLRHWWAQMQVSPPPSRQLRECWQQVPSVSAQHRFQMVLPATTASTPSHVLQHYAQRLYCQAVLPSLPSTPLVWSGHAQHIWGAWQVHCTLVRGLGIALDRLGLEPNHVVARWNAGLPVQLPKAQALRLHTRQGGERLQPHAQRPTRSLKTCFQLQQVPPWQRGRMPLISLCSPASADETRASYTTLIGVLPELIDVRWQATDDRFGLHFTLHPRLTAD